MQITHTHCPKCGGNALLYRFTRQADVIYCKPCFKAFKEVHGHFPDEECKDENCGRLPSDSGTPEENTTVGDAPVDSGGDSPEQ